VILCILVFLAYTLLAVNTAAIARTRYARAGFTCVAYMIVNFYLTRSIVHSEGWYELSLYIVGGLAGDLFGIWLTKYFDRQNKAQEHVSN